MEKKRWLYAAAGVVILFFAGLVYAWSVLASPIGVYFSEWSAAQLSLTFTICMSFFCLGGLFGGLTAGKINVKINVWLASALFLAGFFLASRAQSLIMLYVGFGVLCGMGSGFAYNAVMSTVTKWFPDKPGLISGILLMGFGIGSFVIGKVYQAMTPSGAGVEAWRTSFFGMGVILCAVLLLGSFFLKLPDASFKLPEGGKKAKKNSEEGMEATPGVMLRRPAFWLYFVWVTLMCVAALALISQASSIALGVKPDLDAGTVATAVGLISIFNGIGRILFGGAFDKIGRKKTMGIINVAFLVATLILLLAVILHSFPLIILGFVCIGLAYGGVTPTNSAFVSAFYGAKHYPVNFQLVTLNLLVSSFGSTAAGALYDMSGSYISTFVMMLAAIVLASGASFLIKRP
ncbi:MAG: OFA family MFS transporter [Lachnospiraceae bacterium]|nr:OFA family MFS transporter [Lachnospiraceae bacterium]